MTTAGDTEPFTCAECGNQITTTDDPKIDHHADCPLNTNYWVITYGNELLCGLCDIWLIEGDTYRLIPMLPEELTDDLEAVIGLNPPTVSKPVCHPCSSFKAIRGGVVEVPRTQAPRLG